MTQASERIALLDLDGTLADYDGAMRAELALLQSPTDPPIPDFLHDEVPHLEARMGLIKRQPEFWATLPRLELGFDVVRMLQALNFDLMVLTKGPRKTATAWEQKIRWCRGHLPEAKVTITEDKGLVYGKVLVDDYPPYVQRWLQWRPRGLVIMLAQPWNASFTHPNVRKVRTRDDVIAVGETLKEKLALVAE